MTDHQESGVFAVGTTIVPDPTQRGVGPRPKEAVVEEVYLPKRPGGLVIYGLKVAQDSPFFTQGTILRTSGAGYKLKVA